MGQVSGGWCRGAVSAVGAVLIAVVLGACGSGSSASGSPGGQSQSTSGVLSQQTVDCVLSRSGDHGHSFGEAVHGGGNPPVQPPSQALLPDMTFDMLKLGGDAMTVDLAAPGQSVAQVDVLRFDEPDLPDQERDRDAHQALQQLEARRDETGQLDGDEMIYDLYRARDYLVIVSGDRPLSSREAQAVSSCLNITGPLDRPRPAISGGTDTQAIAQCLTRFAQQHHGVLIDRFATGTTADQPPLFMDTTDAPKVPQPSHGKLKGLWTVRYGANVGATLPQYGADLYLFPYYVDAREWGKQLGAQYNSFDTTNPLRAILTNGPGVLLIYGTSTMSGADATALKKCSTI